jgi:hypothetical protein
MSLMTHPRDGACGFAAGLLSWRSMGIAPLFDDRHLAEALVVLAQLNVPFFGRPH